MAEVSSRLVVTRTALTETLKVMGKGGYQHSAFDAFVRKIAHFYPWAVVVHLVPNWADGKPAHIIEDVRDLFYLCPYNMTVGELSSLLFCFAERRQQ